MGMNFEAPKKKAAPVEQLPLSEDAAMEEAALLKGQIALKRNEYAQMATDRYNEGATFSSFDHLYSAEKSEPSSWEYEEAIKAVQEIRELAAKESDTKYVLFEMARVFHNLVRAGMVPVMIADTVLTNVTGAFAGSERRDPAGFATRELINIDREIAKALTDAEKSLRVLEKQAAKETKKDIKDMETRAENSGDSAHIS
jgi:hypothetical protein